MTKGDDGAWFLAKRYGLGSGLPIRWEGWAFLAAHVALVLIAIPLATAAPIAFTVWVIAITAAGMPVYAAKTRGGWKWRWGDPEL